MHERPTGPRRRLKLLRIVAGLVRRRRPRLRATGLSGEGRGPRTNDVSDSSGGDIAAAPVEGRGTRAAPRANADTAGEDHVTVGELLDRSQHAGFGFLFALLAVLSIPGMGLSTPFGLALAIGGIQMMVGLRRPWMPGLIRRRRLPLRLLQWMHETLPRWTRWLARLVRPRLTFMLRGPLWSLCGLVVTLQGLGLALPLPIPGSNLVFVIPVVLYAIALLEDDGLLVVLCHALVFGQVVLAVVTWDAIAQGVQATFK